MYHDLKAEKLKDAPSDLSEAMFNASSIVIKRIYICYSHDVLKNIVRCMYIFIYFYDQKHERIFCDMDVHRFFIVFHTMQL